MNPKAFVQQLHAAQSQEIYSFYGESYYLISEAVSYVVQGAPRRLFDAKHDKREEILNVLQISSGLFGREVIILHEADHLKKKDLSEIIEKKHASKLLILISSKSLPLEKNIFTLSCRFPYENEMVAWTLYLFQKQKKQVETSAAQILAHLYGRDLDSLAMEIEKILSYVGEKNSITEGDILFVTRKYKEHPIFHILQGWGRRPFSEHLNTLMQLKDSGEPPLFVFNMFVRECKKLLQYKSAGAQGLSQNEIFRKLKISPYFGKALVEEAERFSLEQLEDMTKTLATFDYGIKSGKVMPWNAVESALQFISKR